VAEKKLTEGRALAFYFVLAYIITWGLSWIAVSGQSPSPLVNLSSLLLHYGPALAAIIVAAAVGGRRGIGQLLGKLRQWRVGVGWYVFVLLFPLLTRLLAVGIDLLLGGTAPTFFSAKGIPEGANPILLIVPVFIAVLFQAGLAEEIGWRGFALPRLQTRYNALVSSLILGVLWAIWHFHPQNWPTLAPVAGWYALSVIAFSIVLTWVYNNTGGSLLLVVLLHTASNTADWIVPIVPSLDGMSRAGLLQLAINILVAVALIAIFGAQRLSRKPLPETENG